MYAIARRKAFDTASARLAAFRRRRVPPPYGKARSGEDRHHSARGEDTSKRARRSVVICHDQRGRRLPPGSLGTNQNLATASSRRRVRVG